MSEQLSNAQVLVNNDVVAIIPNTLTFTEGLGEQNIRAASSGGSQTEQVFSDNIEMRYSTVKFEIPSTVENIEKAKDWKVNKNQNLIQVSGRTTDGKLTRTFSQAALLTDYEVPLTSDGNITLEWRANPAV
jgi:hypothetical protein